MAQMPGEVGANRRKMKVDESALPGRRVPLLLTGKKEERMSIEVDWMYKL